MPRTPASVLLLVAACAASTELEELRALLREARETIASQEARLLRLEQAASAQTEAAAPAERRLT